MSFLNEHQVNYRVNKYGVNDLEAICLPKLTTTISVAKDYDNIDDTEQEDDDNNSRSLPRLESVDIFIQNIENCIIVYPNREKIRKRHELNYKYKLIRKKYLKIRQNLLKMIRIYGCHWKSQNEYNCNFDEFRMNLGGICGSDNISRYIRRVKLLDFHHMFQCVWKTCLYESKFIRKIFRHTHDCHICPNVNPKNYF